MRSADVRQEARTLVATGTERRASGDTQRLAAAEARRAQARSKEAHETMVDWREEAEAGPRAERHIDESISSPSRRAKAKDLEKKIRENTREAFELLPPAEQTALIKDAKQALQEMPEMKTLIDSFGGDDAGLDMFVLESLQNLDKYGDIRRAIKVKHKEFFSSPRPQSQELVDARAAFDAKKAEQEDLGGVVKENAGAQAEVDGKIKDFDKSKENEKGTKAYELAEANKEVDKLFTEMAGNVSLMQGISQSEIRDYFARKGDIDSEVTNLAAVIARAERDKTIQGQALADIKKQLIKATQAKTLIGIYGGRYDAKMQPVGQLNAELSELQSHKAELVGQGAELTSQQGKIGGELADLKKTFDKLQADFERQYIKDVQNLPKDALKDLYAERYRQAAEEENTVINDLIRDETDPVAKEIYKKIKDGRWRKLDEHRLARKGFIGKGELEKFDDKQIENDLITLKAGGQAALTEKLVREQLGYAPEGPLTPEQQAKMAEIMESDKFKNEVGPFAVKQLIARGIQRGKIDYKNTKLLKDLVGEDEWDKAQKQAEAWVEKKRSAFGFVGSSKDFLAQHKALAFWLGATVVFPAPGIMGFGVYWATRAIGELRKGKSGHGPETHKKKKKEPSQEHGVEEHVFFDEATGLNGSEPPVAEENPVSPGESPSESEGEGGE